MATRDVKHVGVIIISTDRGLAGGAESLQAGDAAARLRPLHRRRARPDRLSVLARSRPGREAGAGDHVRDGKDPRTGIQVVSLYGKKLKPDPQDLECCCPA